MFHLNTFYTPDEQEWRNQNFRGDESLVIEPSPPQDTEETLLERKHYYAPDEPKWGPPTTPFSEDPESIDEEIIL